MKAYQAPEMMRVPLEELVLQIHMLGYVLQIHMLGYEHEECGGGGGA